MADFGNPNEALANFAKKLQEKAAQTAQTNIPAEGSPVPPASTAPTTEVQNTPPPVEQKPVATATPVEPKPEPTSTNPVPKDDDTIEPWDKDLTPAPVVTGPIALEDLSSALKLENIKSKDDLVAQFTQRETRIKELETAQQQQFLDIPEELREVVDASRKGGDWKAYLGARVVDYSKADPIQLFEQAVETSPRFKRPDGTIDQAAVDLELSQIPDAVKEAQGNMIRQNLMIEQAQRRNAVLQAAEQKRSEFNRGISEAARTISQSLPKEKIGVTLEPKHSDFLYQGIRDGSLIKKHLGNIDVSGIDPNKLVRTLAIAEWGEKFAEHQLKQGVVQGKKSMLAEKQNVQLNTPSIPVNPTQQGDQPKTAADKLRAKFVTGNPGERRL